MGGRTAALALAMLLAARGRLVTADASADEVWGEARPRPGPVRRHRRRRRPGGHDAAWAMALAAAGRPEEAAAAAEVARRTQGTLREGWLDPSC